MREMQEMDFKVRKIDRWTVEKARKEMYVRDWLQFKNKHVDKWARKNICDLCSIRKLVLTQIPYDVHSASVLDKPPWV